MHSDSQQCLNVASYPNSFTALTRVRIPPGTPNKIKDLTKILCFRRGASAEQLIQRGWTSGWAFLPQVKRFRCSGESNQFSLLQREHLPRTLLTSPGTDHWIDRFADWLQLEVF
jgi:hypothetical protein